MTKLDICDAILEKLRTTFTTDEFEVILYPSDLKDYQMSHPNGAILIKAGQVQGNEPINVIQTEFVTFIITFIATSLYGAIGIYNAEIRVRQDLELLRFDSAKPYLTTQSEAMQTDEGLWVTEFTYILPQININE